MMFLFKIFFLVLIIGAFTSIFTFVRDVNKWHDREEKVIIIPSNEDITEEEEGVNEDDSND